MPANDKLFVESYDDGHCSSAYVSSGTNSDDDEHVIKNLKKNLNLSELSLRAAFKPKDPQPEWYQSIPNRSKHEKFIRDAVEVLLNDAVFDSVQRKNQVLEWHDPEELQQLMDFKVKQEPESHEKLLGLLKQVIKYSVKTGHPFFMNQLFASLDPYGLVGQWLTDALNSSVYTYEVSPAFMLMEEEVLREMRHIVGFPNGEGDGIFCPGGSIANGYGICCARYHQNPDAKTKGLFNQKPLIVFTSEMAHYSIKKLSSFLGIGSDNVYAVGTDSVGRICPIELERQVQRALENGAQPLVVSATCGTTVLGAFDPLVEISRICKKYGMWMHVDAAWGGGALMSKKHRYLLEGIENADSVTWNPHKILSVPQQCSVFLTRHKTILSECMSTNATYLFQKDKFYDTSYDTGDKHIQCGRRPDVVKFWFMWKAKGTSGWEKHVDKTFDNRDYFVEQLKKREGFEMVLPNPQFLNVCFWYVPESLRGCKNDPDYNERLHKVAPKIKERMMKNGSLMVTYQPLDDHPNFFRVVNGNSGLEHEDMMNIIEIFETLGKDL